jgi:hypothetical protein
VQQIQEMWRKLNGNERLVGYGAIVVLVSWLVGVVGGGGIGGSWAFLAAIAALVIYYLKYAPNQNINWPAPLPTIVLIITGIAAVLSILGVLTLFGYLGLFFGGLYLIATIGNAVGAAIMAWGAWKEYQAMPKTPPPPPPPTA